MENSNIKQENTYTESEEEKNNRLGNIFFSQLIHICYNMISFKIPKKDVREIILTFSKQNNLPEYYEEQLVIMIESSEYIDYLEMDKEEKERIENEYNQIAVTDNNMDIDNKNIEKRRSKSDFVQNKLNNNTYSNNNKEILRNNSENDFEIINETEIFTNDLKKNRSQSFYENSNTNNLIHKENSIKDTKRNSYILFIFFYKFKI